VKSKTKLKLRCDSRFQRAFTACSCFFKVITLVCANQGNCFENANACSKRTLKTTVATQLKLCFVLSYLTDFGDREVTSFRMVDEQSVTGVGRITIQVTIIFIILILLTAFTLANSESTKRQSSCQSFLHFLDLRVQKLVVECWWHRPQVSISPTFHKQLKTIIYKREIFSAQYWTQCNKKYRKSHMKTGQCNQMTDTGRRRCYKSIKKCPILFEWVWIVFDCVFLAKLNRKKQLVKCCLKSPSRRTSGSPLPSAVPAECPGGKIWDNAWEIVCPQTEIMVEITRMKFLLRSSRYFIQTEFVIRAQSYKTFRCLFRRLTPLT